jgi:preprotein translocase subunit SecD
MTQKLRIRLFGIVLAALIGTIATVAAGWKPSLGLDLQGGTSVVLKPKGDVKPEVLDRTIGIIRSRVDSLGVSEPEISRQGSSVVVSLPGFTDSAQAIKVVGRTAQLTFRPVLGDLRSEAESAAATGAPAATGKTVDGKTVTVGASTTIKGNASINAGSATTKAGSATTKAGSATTKAGSATTKAAATTAAPTTKAGETTAAPTTKAGETTAALGRVTGATPGRYSVAAGATTVAPATVAPTSKPAPIASVAPPALPTPTTPGATAKPGTPTSVVPAVTPQVAPPVAPVGRQPNGNADTTPVGEDRPEDTVILSTKRNDPTANRYLLGPAEIQGAVVETANAAAPNGAWEVDLTLNDSGAIKWDAMAEKYFEQRIAIVLDGEVVSAPSINAKRFGGRAQITGEFDEKEAKGLATALKFGSLPVTLEPATVQKVSATVGKDSLRAGLITGLIGLILVCLYMTFYYRALGLVVIAGLLVSFGIMWTAVSILSKKQGLALSLSGAVGIIVSIGTTVDSYVVFFERMRDELRAGRNVSQSVERGFKSAIRTIIAADFTSLIGALVLYFLTVGSVRGFALFLMISTVIDLIVATLFTKPIVTWIAERQMKKAGLFTGPSAGSGRLTPSAGRITPGSATQGAQL